MKSNFIILYIVFPIMFLMKPVAADTIYQFSIYAENNSGKYIIQTNGNKNENNTDNSKSAPKQCLLSVDETELKNYPGSNGIVKLVFDEKKYPPGSMIKVSVDKPEWYISYPIDKKVILPADNSEIIKIFLKNENSKNIQKENLEPKATQNKISLKSFYVIQVFITRFPNKAIEIIDALKSKGFYAYDIYTTKTQSSYYQHETKIVVGDFHLKSDAEKELRRLQRLTDYKKAFIQLIYR